MTAADYRDLAMAVVTRAVKDLLDCSAKGCPAGLRNPAGGKQAESGRC